MRSTSSYKKDLLMEIDQYLRGLENDELKSEAIAALVAIVNPEEREGDDKQIQALKEIISSIIPSDKNEYQRKLVIIKIALSLIKTHHLQKEIQIKIQTLQKERSYSPVDVREVGIWYFLSSDANDPFFYEIANLISMRKMTRGSANLDSADNDSLSEALITAGIGVVGTATSIVWVPGKYAFIKAASSWEDLTSTDNKRGRAAFRLAAMAGGTYGGVKVGAMIGGLIGACCGGIGAVVGAPLGAIIGGLIGAGFFAWISKEISRLVSTYIHRNNSAIINPSNPTKYALSPQEIQLLESKHKDVGKTKEAIKWLYDAKKQHKKNSGNAFCRFFNGSYKQRNERFNRELQKLKQGELDQIKLPATERVYLNTPAA